MKTLPDRAKQVGLAVLLLAVLAISVSGCAGSASPDPECTRACSVDWEACTMTCDRKLKACEAICEGREKCRDRCVQAHPLDRARCDERNDVCTEGCRG